MKYYTLNRLLNAKLGSSGLSLNCAATTKLFPGKTTEDLISGEELVNALLDSDLPLKSNVLWKNHRWIDNISPESVGETAYKRVLDFLNLKNCDLGTLYGCHDCENVSNAGIVSNAKNVSWCSCCKDCENVLYSSRVRDKEYVILNEKVSKDEFEEKFGLLTTDGSKNMAQPFNVRTFSADDLYQARIDKIKAEITKRFIRR